VSTTPRSSTYTKVVPSAWISMKAISTIRCWQEP
ncbi:uncharacterized protein METZ01_LOCUS308507, partial [marine metagenome]